MVPIVSIVGKSGVGKTTIILRLLAELKKRGYRVATVKHSTHDINLDTEGKDSWKYSQAGSDSVVISSPHSMAMITQVDHDNTLAQLSRFIGLDFDIILAEGFKQNKGIKIEVHRREVKSELICNQDELLAIVTDERLQCNIPQYSFDDANGLIDLIEEKCMRSSNKESIALFINGDPIPLNDFVQGLFTNTLHGMVSSLKRIPKPDSIELSIRRTNTQ